MFRFVVIAAGIAVLAVAAPRFAPALFSAVVHEAATETEPATGLSATPPDQVRLLGGRRVAIPADRAGHYLVEALVNRRAVNVVVDTGATTVALTSATARRLGIVPTSAEFTQPIRTANGIVAAAPVMLSEIRVGGIVVDDVAAVVVPDEALGVNLLGMSFLNRLTKFESGGGELVLVE